MVALDLQAQSVPEAPLVLPDLRVKTVSLDLPALRALPDLRGMLANVDPLVPKALAVFRVPLDPRVVELEEPPFLVPKVLVVPLDQPALRVLLGLLDRRVMLEKEVPLVLMGRRVRMAQSGKLVLPALLDLRAPLGQLARPVRMQSPLSLTSISPRTRQPRPTARKLMLKTHSDRPTRSRTALGTTPR